MESRKRKRLLIALTAGVFAFGIWFFLLRNTEPTYKGRRLSAWVEILAPWLPPAHTAAERAEAAEAIRAIGTNGLPQLVDWVSWTQEGPRLLMNHYFYELPPRYAMNRLLVRFTFGPIIRANAAVEAFAILGHDAVPAIPDLARLVRSSTNPGTRQRALTALAGIGPEAVPTICEIIANFAPSSYPLMLPSTQSTTGSVDTIISALLPQLQNTNLVAAQNVLEFLRNQSIDPGLVARTVGKCLADSRPELRVDAAKVLAYWGWRARVALPALLKALQDTNAVVRTNAVLAIKQIDATALPEAYRK